MAAKVDLERYRDTVRRVAQGFTPGQKAVTVLATVAIVIAAVFVGSYVSRPPLVPLFSGLQPSDAAAITAKLQAAKVPFQLSQGGETILVPQSAVYQERVDMAQAGLPSSGKVGLSILDKTGITTSQFTQQADYQRALQGELSSTIDAIQGISASQVNLVVPPQSVFSLGGQPKATASVLVTLQPGVNLSRTQTQAIVHLVASAVPNLSPNDVTVVDQAGDVLAAPGVNGSTPAQQSQTQAYDSAVQASIDNMLSQLVGTGKAVVVVHSTLDFNQVSTTTQAIQTNPKGLPLTTPAQTQTSSQTYKGTGTPPGGVLGNAANTTLGTGGAGNYTNTSSNTTYAMGKVTQVVHQAPGTVQRMSVSVLVDSRSTPVPVATIQKMVSAAAGLQPARGDTISVVKAPFSLAAAKAAAAAAKAAAKAQSSANMLSTAKTAGLLLIALAAVLLMWRSSKKVSRTEVPLPAHALPQAHIDVVPARELTAATPAAQVEELIDEQPDEVARLLRSWIGGRAVEEIR